VVFRCQLRRANFRKLDDTASTREADTICLNERATLLAFRVFPSSPLRATDRSRSPSENLSRVHLRGLYRRRTLWQLHFSYFAGWPPLLFPQNIQLAHRVIVPYCSQKTSFKKSCSRINGALTGHYHFIMLPISADKIVDLRVKELEILQAVIARLTNYGATLKNYCTTQSAASSGCRHVCRTFMRVGTARSNRAAWLSKFGQPCRRLAG
jgi:hypothetical protein